MGFIETGSLLRRTPDGRRDKVHCQMRFLDESHLEDMLHLQEVISQSLAQKEIFHLSSMKTFQSHFAGGNSILGVTTADGLIAYHILSFPEEEGEENYGIDINLPHEELERVAHLRAVVVHPEYRGNSLQRRMNSLHMGIMKALGYEHACCTVSPKNPYSLENFMAEGLVIKALGPKYDGIMRYIMHRDLLRPRIFGAERVLMDSSDIEGQVDLLREGFCGLGIERRGDLSDFDIVYAIDPLSRA